MKRIFLKLDDRKLGYWIFVGAQTANFSLSNLFFILQSDEQPFLELEIKKDTVILWNSDVMRKQ